MIPCTTHLQHAIPHARTLKTPRKRCPGQTPQTRQSQSWLGGMRTGRGIRRTSPGKFTLAVSAFSHYILHKRANEISKQLVNGSRIGKARFAPDRVSQTDLVSISFLSVSDVNYSPRKFRATTPDGLSTTLSTSRAAHMRQTSAICVPPPISEHDRLSQCFAASRLRSDPSASSAYTTRASTRDGAAHRTRQRRDLNIAAEQRPARFPPFPTPHGVHTATHPPSRCFTSRREQAQGPGTRPPCTRADTIPVRGHDDHSTTRNRRGNAGGFASSSTSMDEGAGGVALAARSRRCDVHIC